MTQPSMTLYYGEDCPNCSMLETYFAANSPERLKAISLKEIYKNRENYEELRSMGKRYGIPEELIGVPFLSMGEKYLMGNSNIIAFLEENLPD